MTRLSQHAAAALVVLTLWLGASARPAAAQTDYLPDNDGWNGLSQLASLARGMSRQLMIVSRLDWGVIGAETNLPVLLLVHPETPIDAERVIAYMRRGGHVLIADDFGKTSKLLEALGISRHDGKGIRARIYYRNNKNLPVALPGPATHTVVEGIRGVVTNHPSYFRSRLPTLLGFQEGNQQVLVAGQVGDGRFAALSDPSVLINAMLEFRGNARLATNLLTFLARDPDARILLVTGHVIQSGELPPAEKRDSRSKRLAQEFSRFVGRINDFALTSEGMRALAFVLGAIALAGLIFMLPLPRKDLDGHWLRPVGGTRTKLDTSPGHAAVALREEIEERLTQALDAPGPISTIHPRWLTERVTQRAGAEAAAICSRLLGALRQVPYTGRAEDAINVARIGRRDLANIYELSQQLLRVLGQPELPPIADPHA
ncbi:MAG: DUF4350 domain-containing protein [Myxococcales bacterium]|nr:DUF4350 domain-containing protein [Myxococcales bacterium]